LCLQEGVEERIPAFVVVLLLDLLEDFLVEFLLFDLAIDQFCSDFIDFCLIGQEFKDIVVHIVVYFDDDFSGEFGVVCVVVVHDLLLCDEVEEHQ
jgi:hypothetical protein